ncbi:MAG: metal-dependent hydrolase [Candidatus Nanoarchaeia archaeon]|nr:metal-dependent hydrolase [Candidatus Nanoarchaeia archaeon]
MEGKTHLNTGILISLISLFLLGISTKTIFLSIVFLIGILFPDIDKMNSIIGRKFKIIGFFFTHRGFFHSIYSVLISAYILNFFNVSIAIFFSLGYILHLIEDMFTKSGIDLFMLGFKISGPLVVGSFTEKIVNLVMLILSSGLIIFLIKDLLFFF